MKITGWTRSGPTSHSLKTTGLRPIKWRKRIVSSAWYIEYIFLLTEHTSTSTRVTLMAIMTSSGKGCCGEAHSSGENISGAQVKRDTPGWVDIKTSQKNFSLDWDMSCSGTAWGKPPHTRLLYPSSVCGSFCVQAYMVCLCFQSIRSWQYCLPWQETLTQFRF